MLLMSINWNSFTPIRILSQGSPSCELHSCWPEVQLEQGCMAGQSSISTQMPSLAEKVNQKHLGLVWHNRRQVVELEAGSALIDNVKVSLSDTEMVCSTEKTLLT